MNNTETKKFSQNVSSSYHLEDRNKNIPKLRFKGYNDEWVEYQLGKICKTYSGGTPNVSNLNFYNGLIPFIKSGEIHSNQTAMYITEEGLKNSSAKLVNKGDLLFALYGATSGEVDISKIDGAINQAILCVKSNYINLIFLKEILSFNKNKILCKYLQGGQGNLSADIFKTLKFKFPTLREQEKIASFLTLIDKKIEKQKELVELLKKYKRGLLSAIFSQKLRFKDDNGNDYPAWEEKRLGNICKIIGGGTPNTNNIEYWGDEINWFTPTEIIKKYVNSSNRKISKLGLSKSSAKILPIGTVLLTTRATLGEMSILSIEATTNQGFQSLIPIKDEVTSEFIYYCQPIIKHFCYKYANGSTFLEISKQTLTKLKLMVPNKDEQSKISKFLSKIDDKIQQEEFILKKLQNYKKGLLQQMFI